MIICTNRYYCDAGRHDGQTRFEFVSEGRTFFLYDDDPDAYQTGQAYSLSPVE